MESLSKTDLLSKLMKQNENLKRYETRLRDVVTAYKGLVKEKEALEASLAVLNAAGSSENTDDSVATLRLSLATVTAEKARIEEAYQADKKQAREQSDKIIAELQEQLNNVTQQRHLELENLKAKLDFEIQEREREKSSHAATIRELNAKLNQEKNLKERMEDKFSISTDIAGSNHEMEKRIRDLTGELEAAHRKLNRAEARSVETPQMLVKLQEEISVMKQNHLAALREERWKVLQAEEAGRTQRAAQEERGAALEVQLAELAAATARLHRQRISDHQNTQRLTRKLSLLDSRSPPSDVETIPPKVSTSETDAEKLADLSNLYSLTENILKMRKQLIMENDRLGNPIDISTVFIYRNTNNEDIHAVCRAELYSARVKFDTYTRQLTQNNANQNNQAKPFDNEVNRLKSHIKTLQEKVDILNQQMEETENEYDDKIQEIQREFKVDKEEHMDYISELKERLVKMEKHLLLQRERYSELLLERESDIRLKNERTRRVSDDESIKMRTVPIPLQDTSAPPHMLHYAHELARKDLDISQLRKDKHLLEGILRDRQRDATIEKDRFMELRSNLKDEIDRLRRIQTREGANLEYLKNVVLSYLTSKGAQNRKHMLNAIGAVLHFTDTEKESINKLKK